MGDYEDALGGKRALLPEVADFATQVFRGQHVQGAEWLIHHQDVRLHYEGTREAYTLAHAAGQLLRIGSLKSLQAHHAEEACTASFSQMSRATPRANKPSSGIFLNRQPREQREALKYHGDVGIWGLRAGRLCRTQHGLGSG